MHLKCQFWGKFAHFSQREFHIRKYHGKILAILLASREWSPSNTVPHLFWVIKPFPKSCCLVLFQLKSLFLTAEVLLVYTLLTLHLSASAQLPAATLLLLDFFLLSPPWAAILFDTEMLLLTLPLLLLWPNCSNYLPPSQFSRAKKALWRRRGDRRSVN